MHFGKLTASLILLAAATSFAQPTTAPSDAPAAMPPSQPPASQPVVADSSTPRGTLLLLSRATAAGDVQTVLSLLDVNTPEEKKLADALMRRNIVNVKFRNALAKSFGDDVATQMAGDASKDESRIGSATVETQEENATVHMGDDNEPVNLSKSDGKWKLSLKGLTGNMTPEQVDQKLGQMKTVVDAIDATSEEVSAGKFKKPDEVELAIRNRLMASMPPPTSGPSGAMPATQP